MTQQPDDLPVTTARELSREAQPEIAVGEFLALFADIPHDWRIMVDSMRLVVLVDADLQPRAVIHLDTLEVRTVDLVSDDAPPPDPMR